MQTTTKNKFNSVAEQTSNTTTSWIGRYAGDNKESKKGQTFQSSSEGELSSIDVFSALVVRSGEVMITLHEFDALSRQWGARLASVTVPFSKSDSDKWISFSLQGVHMQKDKWYGFLLQSPSSLIGIGEAAGTYRQPLEGKGQEWKFTSEDSQGQSFSYFSLAYKVALRA